MLAVGVGSAREAKDVDVSLVDDRGELAKAIGSL